MSEDDRIPTEQLEKARRRLCARIASVIIERMADANSTFEQLDLRLGHKPGHSQAYLLSLIKFDSYQMKELAYLAEALGCDVYFDAVRALPIRPLVNRHIPIEDVQDLNWLFKTKEEWDALDPYTLVEVMDQETTFHIGPRMIFNDTHVLRWRLFVPFMPEETVAAEPEPTQ